MIHIEENAIIARFGQAQNCDNGNCDNRNAAVRCAMPRTKRPKPPTTRNPDDMVVFLALDASSLSQRELADLIGAKPDQLSKARSGDRSLSGSELLRARRVLGLEKPDEPAQPMFSVPTANALATVLHAVLENELESPPPEDVLRAYGSMMRNVLLMLQSDPDIGEDSSALNRVIKTALLSVRGQTP